MYAQAFTNFELKLLLIVATLDVEICWHSFFAILPVFSLELNACCTPAGDDTLAPFMYLLLKRNDFIRIV
jgi:hypothetical protein